MHVQAIVPSVSASDTMPRDIGQLLDFAAAAELPRGQRIRWTDDDLGVSNLGYVIHASTTSVIVKLDHAASATEVHPSTLDAMVWGA